MCVCFIRMFFFLLHTACVAIHSRCIMNNIHIAAVKWNALLITSSEFVDVKTFTCRVYKISYKNILILG